MTTLENPYPAHAVAVFGRDSSQHTTFAFMRAALRPLLAYLEGFPNQYCALALSGGHGSGKTHLLNWMSDEVVNVRHSGARVAYAKSNSPDPLDLYHQIASNWTRDDLVEVYRRALVAIGIAAAGAVRATESAAKEIQDYESLGRAVQEKILDINALNIALRDKLTGTATGNSADTRRRMACALGLLDDTEFGEKAFAWILGDIVAGLPAETLQTGLFSAQTDAGDTSVFALEALAALFKIADIPLVFLIDQIENFLTEAEIPDKSSGLKKLVEQVGSEGAAIVMAGTPGGWERMPRDVGPRLIERQPLIVGALTEEEVRILLTAPIEAHEVPTTIPEEAVETIHHLSGGNAREVLRIAHRAFDAANGDLASLDREMLIDAARKSGTLEDRLLLAEQIIQQAARAEEVLCAKGKSTNEYWLGEQGRALQVIIVVAADASAETRLAREVASRIAEHSAPEGARLIVAIGYSSARVRELLSNVTDVTEFDEFTLKQQVRDMVSRLKSLPTAVPMTEGTGAAPPEPDAERAEFAQRLRAIEELLQKVEEARHAAEGRIDSIVSEKTALAAEPERLAEEMRTRYQLRDGLGELGDALAMLGPEEERRILRRLLVANEIHVKNENFDHLGTIYFDAIDVDRLNSGPLRRNVGIGFLVDRLSHLRNNLIQAMRESLSTSREQGVAGRITFVGLVFLISFVISSITFVGFVAFTTPYTVAGGFDYQLSQLLLVGFVFAGLCTMSAVILLELQRRPGIKYRRFHRELGAIKRGREKNAAPAEF